VNKCPTCQRPFTRSHSQNRFLWGVVYREIAIHTGHSEEEIHEVCKQRFLPKSFVVIEGIETEIHKSTTSLTVPEFSEYLDRCMALAGEMGITLPDRHEEPLI